MAECNLRVGTGIDIHPFASGRKLFIGGVEIQHSQGLAGHSDADVLLHSLTDAILGALGWGDIGQWFPNTDEKFRDKDSLFFLKAVWERAAAEGWSLVNCDNMILAEAPKMAPHIPAMRRNIADVLGAAPERIGIKATTTEQLGFVGRGEGMAAQSVVLLQQG